MVFYTIVVFIISIVLQIILFLFLSPYSESELNYINIMIFSLNIGVLIGSLFSIILFFAYWVLGAYKEIIYKSFLRRSVLLGLWTSINLFLRMIDLLDYILFGGIILSFIILELYFIGLESKKKN
jgi:hypothetical protein